MSQEKLRTMIVQNFGGVKEVYYGICASRENSLLQQLKLIQPTDKPYFIPHLGDLTYSDLHQD